MEPAEQHRLNMTDTFYENEGYSKYSMEDIQDHLAGNSRFNVFVKQICSLIKINEKTNVLDIGCGEGALLRLLKKEYPENEYYGTDISNKATSIARQNNEDICYDTNDFNKKTSYAADLFDLVICGEVIEHLHDTDNFFCEINRILKQNGHIVLSTPNLSSWIGRVMLLFGFLPPSMEISNQSRQFGRKIFYRESHSQAVGHIKSFTWRSLEDISEYYGFEIIDHRGAWFRPFAPNKLVTYLFPALSQEQVIVLKKVTSYNN